MSSPSFPSVVRAAGAARCGRTRPVSRSRPALEVLEGRILCNVGDGFVYRLENLRTGTYPSITLSTRTLDATIIRPGSNVVLAFPGRQAANFTFGNVSISPFNDTSSRPYIMNFSNYVKRVVMHGGDYGGDDPDQLRMEAFSGPNATGTLLTNVRVPLPTDPPGSSQFREREFGVQAGFIKSVRFIGGSTTFPNSVFYDNISIVYHRPNYRGVSMVWDPVRGGATVTYRLENNWIDDKQFPVARLYWSKGRDQFGRHQLIQELSPPVALRRNPSFGAPYSFNIPGWRLRSAPAAARELVCVLDGRDNAPEASEIDNTLTIRDVQLFRGHARGDLSSRTIDVVRDALRIAGESAVTASKLQLTPWQQASAMYNDIRRYGLWGQYRKYGPAGDSVLLVYQRITWGLTNSQIVSRRATIVAEMSRQIYRVGPLNVTRHTSDPTSVQVVDIDPKTMDGRARTRFILALRADPRVRAVFLPTKADPYIHLEVYQ